MTAIMPNRAQPSDRYMPALDGLRAISILLVVISHAGLGHIVPGGLGVIIFFVISGFLISRLMIAELMETGKLDIKRFYIRRILRLLPTLLLWLLIFVPLAWALGVGMTFMHVISAIFYFANYYHMYFGYPPYNPFPILWSLAVEEHFYIFFPFLVQRFRGDFSTFIKWLTGAVLVILAWRFLLNTACSSPDASYALCGLPDGARIYKGTDSIADSILYGVLIAFALHLHPQRTQQYLINRPAFGVAATILLLTLVIREETFRATLRYSLQGASIAVLIVNILFGEQRLIRTILEHPILVVIGRWSYALYLFHFAVAVAIGAWRNNPDGLHDVGDILIYFLLTFTLAAAAYYGIERPMQKLRQRFRRH